MTRHLTAKEKSQSRLVLSLVVTALLIEKVGGSLKEGQLPTDLPAVRECTLLVDEILEKHEKTRRDKMIARLQTIRVRLTKQVSKLSLEAGLVGALRYITSDNVKPKPATRLAYIKDMFTENLKTIETVAKFNNKEAEIFEKELRKHLRSL
jgi:hypothetical protein